MAPETKKEGELGESDAADHQITINYDTDRVFGFSIDLYSVTPMDTQQPQQSRRRLPNVQFRVLIIGRANAGKTSILQRICETTESPTIYRGNERVCGPILFACESVLTAD